MTSKTHGHGQNRYSLLILCLTCLFNQIIKNMTDNQVAHVRNFLETYAPNTTPQVVVKALDYISPSERFNILKIKLKSNI